MALNSTYGYDFHFIFYESFGDIDKNSPINAEFTLPITPPSLKITSDSNNETVTLINMGEVSVINTPPLTTYSFTARFPMTEYPYSRLKYPKTEMTPEERNEYISQGSAKGSWLYCFKEFKKAKEEKRPFRFIVFRNDNDFLNWGTNVLVTLEKMEINEDANEGDDVLVDFELKQYREYKLVHYKDTTPKQSNERKQYNFKYKIKKGENLEEICKKFGDDPKEFIKRNKKVLDAAVARANREDGVRDCQDGALLVYGTEVIVKQRLYDSEAKWYEDAIKKQITPEDYDREHRNGGGVLSSYSAIANQYGTKTEHKIKLGDTLSGIALAYYGSTEYMYLIMEKNPQITDMNSLKNLEGKTIVIPRKVDITIPEVSD